jgi:hypothetical protein
MEVIDVMPTIRTTKGEYIVDDINEIDVCPACGSTKLVRSPERGRSRMLAMRNSN